MVRARLQTSKSLNSRKQVASKSAATPSPTTSAKGSQKTIPSSSWPSCSGCGCVITDDAKALQCDHCKSSKSWKCSECLHVSDELYDKLILDPQLALKWFCESCEKAVSDNTHNQCKHNDDRLDHLISAIEKLMEKYESIDKKLADKSDAEEVTKLNSAVMQLEQKITKHEQEVSSRFQCLESKISDSGSSGIASLESQTDDEEKIKKVVQQEMDKKSTLENDFEHRKRNIIIYRIPEKKTENVADRKVNDETFVNDLLDCVFNMKLENGDIEKMYRLGRWTEDKARPLLVAFKSYEQKQHIMTNLRNLKLPVEKFRGIGISHDLHPKEREENKRTVKEAQEAHAAESDGVQENVKFLVVGHGEKRRVIKIQKRN